MSDFDPAGGSWAPDPTGRHQLRYWNGSTWTDHVSDGGVTGSDPVGAPPAYGQAVGYGYAPGVAGRGKAIRGLATALSVLLSITAVAALVLAGALFNRASVLEDPFGASFDELQGADDGAAAGAGFFLLSFVATGILWIVWQYRHAKNARALGQTDGLAPGWAIGGWFIPLANWILPGLQLKQAAEASDPTGARKAPPIVIVWWILWAIGGFASFSTRNSGNEEIASVDDIESFRTGDQLAAVGMLVVIAAALVAVVMVRSLSQRQHQAFAARGMQL